MSPAYCLAMVALLAQTEARRVLASNEARYSMEFTNDSLAEVKQNVTKGDAVLVDVRSQQEWNRGHIEGTIFLPVDSLRKKPDPKMLAKKLPKKKIIYTFCVVGMRAKTAAIKLEQQGYTVRALEPGYDELIEAGFEKAAHTPAADHTLESIERRIIKEPRYESTPQYLLLAFGANAETLVWLVEDGRTLYLDSNTNGDLTDDGPPITPSDLRQWQRSADSDAKSWDFDYVLGEFATRGNQVQKAFHLRRWNYGEVSDDSYGLSLTLDGKVPMYAGWVPFWAPSPDKASIIHFGGELTPRLLRYKEFVLGTRPQRLSLAFINPGLGEGGDSRLSIDALPADAIPELHIQWPTAEGKPSLKTSHRLYLRCCYWEFYTTEFEIPPDVAVGSAIVKVHLPPDAMPLPLATSELTVPVVAAPTQQAN
jgi:phage shock protein E